MTREITIELSNQYCIYCLQPLDNLEDISHPSCSNDVIGYATELSELRRQALEQAAYEVRSHRAIRRAETLAYNKTHQIERINKLLYYQFLDHHDCVIFVCYKTIIGVLHNHKFYTVENNFSRTTGQQLHEILPYGGIPKKARHFYKDYEGKDCSYGITVYPNHTELPIREFERLLSKIGITHLQYYGEGTGSNYYYTKWAAPNDTWLNICETGWTVNLAADKLANWIARSLDFNKERYEIYLKNSAKEISLKIWDRKLYKYKTLGYARKRWTKDPKRYPFTQIWKYGLKPLQKLLLKQRGFKEL